MIYDALGKPIPVTTNERMNEALKAVFAPAIVRDIERSQRLMQEFIVLYGPDNKPV